MNRLLEQLAKFCDAHRLAEKILVTPSLAVGHQIAESLVRAGHPWVNLRTATVHTLAHGVVNADLVEQGVRMLSRAQAFALIEQACFETLKQQVCFGGLRDKPGFLRALKGTLEDIQAAEISLDDLPADSLGDGGKIRDLRTITHAYERLLAENRLVDEAEVLRRALEKLKQGLRHPLPDACYLLPESLDLSVRAQNFLGRLANGKVHVLGVDHPSTWNRSAESAQIFSAIGEENEVREVFRRLARDGIGLDQTEILYTDRGTYLPLIYELSAEYHVPCTYAEGIPAVFSRTGQAVLGYLDWLAGDYDANSLKRVIGSDLVDLRKVTTEGEPPGAVHAARVLRDAGVGWGRDRHLSCLDALVRLYEVRERERAEDGEGLIHQRFHTRQTATARAVRSFVHRLLVITPKRGIDGKMGLRELAHGAVAFMAEFARRSNELDGVVSAALEQLFDELSVLPDTRLMYQDVIRRLSEAVRNVYAGASTPRAGHLHVSDLGNGGYSARNHTFVLGLDESRYPGTGLQDPVLLDNERREINAFIRPHRLPLLGERPEENREALQACLARLRGKTTLSYSCRNLLEDREQFPSTVVLEIHRSLARRPEADYTDLRSALGRPCGFSPADEICLDETEWWLRRLPDLRTHDDECAWFVRCAYPWLERGWQARQERASDRFTTFDGRVKDVGRELDPRISGKPISCTEIEALARCPFAYFLRYVLEVEPPEDWERDPTVWLGAREFGSLLHEVFHAFMTEITARKERPRFAQHWPELKAVAEKRIDDWRGRVPPPNIVAFNTQRNHVLLACQTFLRNEEIHCERVSPQYFEVPFGLSGVASASFLGSQSPVSIDLGEGGEFLLRGRIDRIDLRDSDEYEVWDYKSGSPRMVREEKQLNRGRQVQHALYAHVVEILLARAQKRGRVVRSGYFFPGPKGEGQRITKEQDMAALERVISVLFDLLREGIFPYAPDSDFCGSCDYQRVCGGPERANDRTNAKLRNQRVGPSVLEPLRRLMACDD